MILVQYKKLYIKITIGFCLFQEEMAPKTQVAKVPISVEYTCNDLWKWYLDIHGVEGAQFHKVHLFIAEKENDSLFKDVGQVVEASISAVDCHPEVECIDILVLMNQEFQLSPGAYALERMARNKEETMFSRGWKFTESNPNITANQLQSSIIATLQTEKGKSFTTTTRKQESKSAESCS